MGQRKPYMPRADGPFRDWLNNYVRFLLESPGLFNQSSDVAEEAQLIAAKYEAAYVDVASPGPRTPSRVAYKNTVRAEARRFFRSLSMQIKVDRSIPDDLKVRIGVIAYHSDQSRIPEPTGQPQLMVEGGLRGQLRAHRVRYFDPKHPDRKAKPYGVVDVQLMIGYADHVLGSAEETLLEGQSKRIESMRRHVQMFTHPANRGGRVATYWARWMTQRGLAGPWSAGVSMRV